MTAFDAWVARARAVPIERELERRVSQHPPLKRKRCRPRGPVGESAYVHDRLLRTSGTTSSAAEMRAQMWSEFGL
jgi:hypothetical protein